MRDMQATVVAAAAGDQAALDELIEAYLPLVYNIVGRALAAHADVDDVVQETMIQVIRGLPGLRDPERFRSWLVAIAMRQVRSRWRARTDTAELIDVSDPGADFVDLAITRLQLTGQRREVAEATRWLDEDDRQLLSLWWLEAAGQLTRPELAEALQLKTSHVTVRVHRMRAQLDAARAVVRALRATPRCPELERLLADWDGRPNGLWRKRLARHTRECPWCERFWADLVPAERLLAGVMLVPVPAALTLFTPAPSGTSGASGTSGTTGASSATGAGGASGAMALKPLVAVAATVAVLAGASLGVYALTRPAPAAPAAPAAPLAADTPLTASASPTPETPSPSPSLSPSPRVSRGPRYGSVVDRADTAPPKETPPAKLPHRPETAAITAIGGLYLDPKPGFIGGKYVMMHRGENVVLSGKGYFRVRYEIAWFNRPGMMVMPTWTGLQGKLFHVASGGTLRMDDPKPNAAPDTDTWMGQPDAGYVVLPAGAQQMWQNEFFYLDGQVTLTNNERGADYNITAHPVTWAEVVKDITTPPPPAIRYGLVRDTGDDGAPVPQYCTRDKPSDPAQVAQNSKV